MSKINQIQNGLLELGGGAFQKLCDPYLYKKGYEHINPLGSVIGSNKVRKGTPDTFVPLSNGKYVFAEYTTQQSGVYEKLKSDLDKCFDEKKTGVPIQKIEELIFCHTTTLEPPDRQALAQECQKRGIKLSIFGIGPLSQDLYHKYPGLARDFLGIEVDTGQIVPPDEFVSLYNKNALATPLDTTFCFREKEVEQTLNALRTGDLILVSGRPGVGKTRFALECCARVAAAEKPQHKVLCVFNRGPDLFEDLRVHFSEPGQYLIFVDDANRINRFEYVLQLLHDQNDGRRIRIIATVRDYALETILEMAQPYEGGSEVRLAPLDDKQIRQLVDEECGVKNESYLERIADIAKGNPRLAIMAAQVATRENTLRSISDVTVLYDQYFSSIRQDIEEIDNQDLLKVSAIVTFFRAVDRSNEEMMSSIEKVFKISPEAFWEAAHRLHEIEALDMYESEVVKVSDQVLATYLFYRAFFKRRVLDFSLLLTQFFPRLRSRLIDAMTPVVNTFYSETLLKEMRSHVDKIWKTLEEKGNEESLLDLIRVFWFLKQTDSLRHIQDRISRMQHEPIAFSKLNFEPNPDTRSSSLINVLGSFKYATGDTLKMAVGLLLRYLAKRPGDLPQVAYLLTDRFGFDLRSHEQGLFIQREIIDALWDRAREGENRLFSKLFLTVAEVYLRIRFDDTDSKDDGRTITISEFELRSTPELFELRQTIWRRVFSLYKVSSLRDDVLATLQKHSEDLDSVSVPEIVSQDASEVLRFIESMLDPNSYRHSVVVHRYLDLLDTHKVAFDEELRDRFSNDTFVLAELLRDDWTEMWNLELGYEEYQDLRKKRISDRFYSYGFSDYKRFFKQCHQITEALKDVQGYWLNNGISQVLATLANRNHELYAQVLAYYLGLGDPFALAPTILTGRLIQAVGSERAVEILNGQDFPSKGRWLFGFYQALPRNDITPKRLDDLYTLYRKATRNELPPTMDFLLKYGVLDEGVFVRVTRIILEKAENDKGYADALSKLFNRHTEANEDLIGLFGNNISLLKRAYLAVSAIDKFADHDGQTFNRILDLDPGFLREYINFRYAGKKWLSRHDDTRNYSFLRKRDDYEELLTDVIKQIYEKERNRCTLFDHYIEVFFRVKDSENENLSIVEKQDHVLRRFIEHRHNDSELMHFLFSIIANFPPDRQRPFVAHFLNHNKAFRDFERLLPEPTHQGCWGSAVPMLQDKIEYFESLLPLVNTIELLQHKQCVERYIQALNQEIEHEKRKDFVEDRIV